MKTISRLFLTLTAGVLLIGQAKALTVYALNDTNRLLTFDSATPGTVTDLGAIGNLPVGTVLVGLDIRTATQPGSSNPGVGSLWAIGHIGTSFRLFVITPTTPPSAAGVGSSFTADTSAGDEGYQFGYDSGTDRFRLTSVQFNYSVNPNSPSAVSLASYAGFPTFRGVAFTPVSFGATSQLYNIDGAGMPDFLQIVNPSTAAVTPVGSLTIGDVSMPAGFDIAQGLSLLAFNGILYSVNLSSGAATLVGNLMGAPDIRGLAIVPASFPPAAAVSAKIKGPKKVTTTSSSRVIKGTAASVAGITKVQVKVGKGKFKNAKGTTSWKFTAKLKPGLNTISVQATGGNAVKSSIAKIKVTRE